MHVLEAKIQDVRHEQQSHDKVCAERYKHINTSLVDLHDTVTLIFGRFWKIAGILILILLGVVGYLYVENNSLQHNNTEEITNEL